MINMEWWADRLQHDDRVVLVNGLHSVPDGEDWDAERRTVELAKAWMRLWPDRKDTLRQVSAELEEAPEAEDMQFAYWVTKEEHPFWLLSYDDVCALDLDWWDRDLDEDGRQSRALGQSGGPLEDYTGGESRVLVNVAGWMGMENSEPDRAAQRRAIDILPSREMGTTLDREFIRWVARQPQGFWRP